MINLAAIIYLGLNHFCSDKMNAQQIEDEIVAALRAIPSLFPNGASKKERTRAIKIAISDLGYKHDYPVCGDPRPNCDAAFLYDLSWYSSTPAPEGNLLEVPLVLESEWDARYKWIKFDFEKLLIAKSKFKVMVFQASGQTVTDYYKQLEQVIRSYQGGTVGEIYLLVCYDVNKREFEIKRIEGAS